MRIQPLALGLIAVLAFIPLALQAQAPAAPELPPMPAAAPAPATATASPAPVATPPAAQNTAPKVPEMTLPAAAPAPAAPAANAPVVTLPAMPEPVATTEAPKPKPAAAATPTTKKKAVKKKKKAAAKKEATPAPSKSRKVESAAKAPEAAGPHCNATARISTQNYPGAKVIPTTNNLLQPAGKALEADGQKIVITGRVMDAQCAPVPGAIVELWQNSPTGRWLLANSEDLASAGKVFAGAGRTYTDGEGKFTFITAFPAPMGNKAPFVNVKVTGEGLSDLMTALYFSDDTRNEADATYKKLAGTARSDVTIKVTQDDEQNLTGSIDLVLSGKAPYQTY